MSTRGPLHLAGGFRPGVTFSVAGSTSLPGKSPPFFLSVNSSQDYSHRLDISVYLSLVVISRPPTFAFVILLIRSARIVLLPVKLCTNTVDFSSRSQLTVLRKVVLNPP